MDGFTVPAVFQIMTSTHMPPAAPTDAGEHPPVSDELAMTRALEQAILRRDTKTALDMGWRLYYSQFVLYLLSNHVPMDHIDDLLQDVFALAMVRFKVYEDINFRNWLFRLVHYAYLTWKSTGRRNRIRDGRLRDVMKTSVADFNDMGQARRLVLVVQLLREETPENAEIILASYRDGLNDQEISALLERRFGVQIAHGAVKKRRQRLRSRLAERMKPTTE